MLSNNMRLNMPAAQLRIKFTRKLDIRAVGDFENVLEVIVQKSEGTVGKSIGIIR
jgi:hypothetical protein